LRVRTGPNVDPRIVGRLVYRIRDADAPVLLCGGRPRCIVAPPSEPGTYKLEAMFLDAWGRTSAPTYSAPLTIPSSHA
jgi:hypothetical protein